MEAFIDIVSHPTLNLTLQIYEINTDTIKDAIPTGTMKIVHSPIRIINLALAVSQGPRARCG